MPSMHEMIDELNDIECSSCPPTDSTCNCLGGFNNFGGGCGFGSWIWILLILFMLDKVDILEIQDVAVTQITTALWKPGN